MGEETVRVGGGGWTGEEMSKRTQASKGTTTGCESPRHTQLPAAQPTRVYDAPWRRSRWRSRLRVRCSCRRW